MDEADKRLRAIIYPNGYGLWERYCDLTRLIGFGTAVVTFLASWVYCIYAYGFLFGLGLGWLPSGILAVAVGFIMAGIWPLVVLLLIWAVYAYWNVPL